MNAIGWFFENGLTIFQVVIGTHILIAIVWLYLKKTGRVKK